MPEFSRPVVLFCAVFNLTACYEDPKFVIHESHIYKGKEDSHDLETLANSEDLQKRFKQIQLDR